jgi:antitoxin component YwqK of YwqJK toxin-antitoxin module
MRITKLTTNICPRFRGDNKEEIVRKEFYPNGKISLIKERSGACEYHYEQGGKHFRIEPDGTEKGWYMNGAQSYIKHPNGVYESFYQNGKLRSISRPDRSFENWDEDGFLRFEKLKNGTTIAYPSLDKKIITYPDGRIETIKTK